MVETVFRSPAARHIVIVWVEAVTAIMFLELRELKIFTFKDPKGL